MCNKTIGLTTNRASGKSPTWPVTSLFVRQDFHQIGNVIPRHFKIFPCTSRHFNTCCILLKILLLPFANDVSQLASILRFTIYGESEKEQLLVGPRLRSFVQNLVFLPGLEHEK